MYLSIKSIVYALYFINIFNEPSGLSFARGAFWGVSDIIRLLSVSSGRVDSGKPFLSSEGSSSSFIKT
jgi:hypothetical protein